MGLFIYFFKAVKFLWRKTIQILLGKLSYNHLSDKLYIFFNFHKKNFRFAIYQEKGWDTRNFKYLSGEFRIIMHQMVPLKLISGNNSKNKLTTV